jgi:starch synthase (maltosyl-transferring)
LISVALKIDKSIKYTDFKNTQILFGNYSKPADLSLTFEIEKYLTNQMKNHFEKSVTGKTRIVVENIKPQLNSGEFHIKAIKNDIISIEADILIDGHDLLAARLLFKHQKGKVWSEVPMLLIENDKCGCRFRVEEIGVYEYKIEAWVDHIATWQHEVEAKVKAGVKLGVELMQGEVFFREMAAKAKGDDKKQLTRYAKKMTQEGTYDEVIQIILSHYTSEWSTKYPQYQNATESKILKVVVDRERARFSAWYSIFPRSAAREYGEHGTFKDVEMLLPRIAELGFDVLYLPPVHPIGTSFRKGQNNSTTCHPGEPGVPYGIGSELGGHTAIHPELGTLEDFKNLIEACKPYGIEMAMDLAIQCSPDHPWVTEHPDWFKILPDGTIKYAENPPKKYQDIYPVNFENDNWKNLWDALKDVIFTWADWGVKIIRVDNPHTKSFGFWEWVIAETKAEYPDMIFLSEAFTKPKVMQQLAKAGFTQSYTYYTWRNSKHELIEYMTELTQSDMQHYFRPNFWPNTHDINPFILHDGNEAQFLIRYFMAATLSSNYGIFGPTYEYMYYTPNLPKEEYFNSEKYEIKWWNWEHRNKLTYVISDVNKHRKENSALQLTNNISFCGVQDDDLLAYLKTHENGNKILCVVNLSSQEIKGGFVNIPLWKIGKNDWESYRVRDLISGAVYTWSGSSNYIELDPAILPFHLFRIEDL